MSFRIFASRGMNGIFSSFAFLAFFWHLKLFNCQANFAWFIEFKVNFVFGCGGLQKKEEKIYLLVK